jgi:hypothetical protein
LRERGASQHKDEARQSGEHPHSLKIPPDPPFT